jgi:hypothetical protein
VQNQGRCGSCWAFSITGLIEAQTHIQHGFWAKLSEADLFESSSRSCNAGWDFLPALDMLVTDSHGLADSSCNIYYDKDRPFLGCGDREGRTLEFGDYHGLETTHDEKRWLNEVGPITCAIDVYLDFKLWKAGDPPYRHTNHSQDLLGGHGLLIVGYNDAKESWIVKNSWGSDWGDDGYIEIAYGEVRIDDFQNNTKYGVTNLSPSQAQRRRHRNGMIFQSANGTTHRDLQVLRVAKGGTLLFLQYSGETPNEWSVISDVISPILGDLPPEDLNNFFNESDGRVTGQPILFSSSFGRQKEVMYWVQEKGTFAHWYSSNVEDLWFQTPPGGAKDFTDDWHGDIAGYPGFIQTDDSNFTVVVKTINNGEESLTEYFRNVDIGNFTTQRFVTPSGILQSGPSLVQSNIGLNLKDKGSQGNLHVVAVTTSNQLQLFWRSPSEEEWHEGELFGEGIPNTPPIMIQDFWGTKDENAAGGFQLLVANSIGNVEHWQGLNHNALSYPPTEGKPWVWEKVSEFGNGEVKHVWGLVQGSFNFGLEAIVEDIEGDLWHWRYNGEWEKGDKLPDHWDVPDDEDNGGDEEGDRK